jgi:16S rRNA (adenine1518-N6/adenine1519-N6)-dimethyltransferase
LETIVAAANLALSDRVLEIGPGQGVLTRRLLPQVAILKAVEIDRDLCHTLRKKLGEVPNFELIEGDFLKIPETNWESLNKVVANIPYNITGPILEVLLGRISQPRWPPFEQIVLLVQKEVADRLCARAGRKTFGALSVRVQYLAHCEVICRVSPQAFQPPPQVESAVVRLSPRTLVSPAQNSHHLERLIQMGFANKRKMLHNNLKGWIERDRLDPILETLQLDLKVRAEDLSLEQWVVLSNRLASG